MRAEECPHCGAMRRDWPDSAGVTRGDETYCCSACADAAETAATGSAGSGGSRESRSGAPRREDERG